MEPQPTAPYPELPEQPNPELELPPQRVTPLFVVLVALHGLILLTCMLGPWVLWMAQGLLWALCSSIVCFFAYSILVSQREGICLGFDWFWVATSNVAAFLGSVVAGIWRVFT